MGAAAFARHSQLHSKPRHAVSLPLLQPGSSGLHTLVMGTRSLASHSLSTLWLPTSSNELPPLPVRSWYQTGLICTPQQGPGVQEQASLVSEPQGETNMLQPAAACARCTAALPALT